MTYQKPLVEKFGSFRELTQLGLSSASDGASIFGISGCQTGPISLGCPTDPTTS